MAEAIHQSDAERAAVIFYGATLLVIQALLGALGIGHGRPSLSGWRWTRTKIKAITLAATPTIGFYLAVIVLAFGDPVVAVYGFLRIAIVSAPP